MTSDCHSYNKWFRIPKPQIFSTGFGIGCKKSISDRLPEFDVIMENIPIKEEPVDEEFDYCEDKSDYVKIDIKKECYDTADKLEETEFVPVKQEIYSDENGACSIKEEYDNTSDSNM